MSKTPLADAAALDVEAASKTGDPYRLRSAVADLVELTKRLESCAQSATRESIISECIAALDERVDSLTIMCDRAGYTREGSDLAQRVSATRDAIDVIRGLYGRAGSRAQPSKEVLDAIVQGRETGYALGERDARVVTEEMVERALEAAGKATINFRRPWHADERATVRAMLESALRSSDSSAEGGEHG